MKFICETCSQEFERYRETAKQCARCHISPSKKAMVGVVYSYIVRFKRGHDGIPPTIREIMVACGISSTSVTNDYVEALREMGWIRKLDLGSRCIAIPSGQWVYGGRYVEGG